MFVSSQAALAETIYATNGRDLLRFDSESPETIEQVVAVTVPFHEWPPEGMGLEFDFTTGELYAFPTFGCPTLCPGPKSMESYTIAPATGVATYTGWQALPTAIQAQDFDIHPLTHEFRFLTSDDHNYRFSLNTHQLIEDTSLSLSGPYPAVAHAPLQPGDSDVETFAIRSPWPSGPELVRIGGPGGNPPASTGQVTIIGAVSLGELGGGFDISPDGVAYLSVYGYSNLGPGGPQWTNRLVTIDLATAEVQEIGPIGGPTDRRISGIAVVPAWFGSSVMAIPTLDGGALATMTGLFAIAGVAALLRGRATSPRRST